jgi:2-polyprenyl-6-methoxyphenol hydroxylase-like FAD-dependent oxidoreductase
LDLGALTREASKNKEKAMNKPSSDRSPRYDAIVVGARCAGSPTAMHLADKGYKVLVVDRSTFPSDTLSTLIIHPPGVDALRRWGLLVELAATGCPPIDTYSFHFGPVTISGSPGTPESPVSYTPRRTVLDKMLVDAAARAGAEVREGFAVEEVVMEDGRVTGIRGRERGGPLVTETASVVIGADGRHSRIAKAVGAEQYHERPELNAVYYTFFSGVPATEVEVYTSPWRGIAAWPTHHGLTLVLAGWPYSEFDANRHNLEASFWSTVDLVPELAARLRAGKQEERITGGAIANFFRKPFGPGWALVGDAGYNKDSITAQGIQDAFRDSELLAGALDEALSGAAPYDQALGRYQATRDQHVLPMFEFTCQMATLEPPPPDMQQLIGAMAGNQLAMDGFIRTYAGVTSPAEFFDPENIGRIFAGASEPAAL